MFLNNFKVGGFKIFGDIVELNMKTESKNTTYLKENLIEQKINNFITKNMKTSIIYGGNNTGKSTLLESILIMKRIFKKGDVIDFPFDEYKNFCFNHDELIKFEVDFNNGKENIIYGIEFSNEDSIGEYVFLNDDLLFSRNLEGNIEGDYTKLDSFNLIISNLTKNKLVVPYFINYYKEIESYKVFKDINTFFNKIKFIDNRRNEYSLNLLLNFMNDKRKLKVLNELIKSTEIYLEERKIITQDEFINSKFYNQLEKMKTFENLNKIDSQNISTKEIIDSFRVTSVYKDNKGQLINKPSLMFDSVGTNKFLNLSMIIINSLIEGNILLIDEFDSSLHHKLTRVLVILMNSEANNNAQFILTTHDVNLLSTGLFRKDQVNFITRDDNGVLITSLDNFKANSYKDIRNTSNFEKMYIEEKIVPLPETNIYNVIKEILKNE